MLCSAKVGPCDSSSVCSGKTGTSVSSYQTARSSVSAASWAQPWSEGNSPNKKPGGIVRRTNTL
jgi:hypothetical protein